MAKAAAVIDVRGEREQREILTIEVIFEIEHFRKSRPREWLLVPGAIGLLRPGQPVDAGANGLAPLLTRRQQSEQRPGGL